MDLESGTIRPRRRDRNTADASTRTTRAERSTRVLIRVPHIATNQPVTANLKAPHSASALANSAASAAKPSADKQPPAAKTTLTSITTAGSPQGSTSAEPPLNGPLSASETRRPEPQSVPESNISWRMDAAHTGTVAPHSQIESRFPYRTGWLMQVFERKSLLALGIILLATGVVTMVMLLFNQTYQHLHPSEKFGDGTSVPPTANQVHEQPFIPAPPRVTSENDSRLSKPTFKNTSAKGPDLGNSNSAPTANRGLPAGVLGTTYNDPSSSIPATVNGWPSQSGLVAGTPAAMNVPAEISARSFAPANAPSQPSTVSNTPSPVMADYHLPQRAVPRTNELGTGQNYPGLATRATGAPASEPIIEARRETLPAVAPAGTSATSNFSSGARFDGGIGKPLESIPR